MTKADSKPASTRETEPGPKSQLEREALAESAARPTPVRKDEDEPMLYCPVCSARLTQHKCKLVCPKCGYYMSCADYY